MHEVLKQHEQTAGGAFGQLEELQETQVTFLRLSTTFRNHFLVNNEQLGLTTALRLAKIIQKSGERYQSATWQYQRQYQTKPNKTRQTL